MNKKIPEDVYYNYIYKNDKCILVKDPKHYDVLFHYTIWYLEDINNILCIRKEDIINIKAFLEEIKVLNLFDNEKKYFTYPPTHDILHLHIVPSNYISYRRSEELVSWDYIKDI